MRTESFIMPENLVTPMKGWGDFDWEMIRADHKPVVDRAFEDEIISYLSQEYDSKTIERAKLLCVESLGELVDSFRADNPQDSQPKDLDWAEFFCNYDKQPVIAKKLCSDAQLKKAMGDYISHDSINISIRVAEEYNTLVSDRDNVSYS